MIVHISRITDSNFCQKGKATWLSVRAPQREVEGECPMEVKKIIGHRILISYS